MTFLKDHLFSKDYGGMGFKAHKAFNFAMLAKQAWNLFKNPSNLITKQLKFKYFSKNMILLIQALHTIEMSGIVFGVQVWLSKESTNGYWLGREYTSVGSELD